MATYYCNCSSFFSCQKHLFLHLKEKKTHEITRITEIHYKQYLSDLGIIEKTLNIIKSTQDELSEIMENLIKFGSEALDDLSKLSNFLQLKKIELKNSLFNKKANETHSMRKETQSIQTKTSNIKKKFIKNLSDYTKKYLKTTNFDINQEKYKKNHCESLAVLNNLEMPKSDQWKLNFFADNIGKITSVAVSKNEVFIAFGSEDSTVRVFNLLLKNLNCILIGHQGKVLSVEISSSEKLVVSGSEDKTIRIWDIYSKKQLKVLKNRNNIVNWLCLSENDKYLVSPGVKSRAFIWMFEESFIIFEQNNVEITIKPLFSSSTTLVYINRRGLAVLDILTSKSRFFYGIQTFCAFTLCNDRKNALVYSQAINAIIEISLENMKNIRIIPYNPSISKNNSLYIAYNPEIEAIFISDKEAKVDIISYNSKKTPIWLNQPHTSIVQSSKLGAFYYSTKNNLEIFRCPENQIESITAFSYFNASLSTISNDMQLFLYPSFESQVSALSIELGQVICELPGTSHQLTSLTISKSNSRVVTTYTNGELKVWNLQNASLASTYYSDSKNFTCMSFSSQETFLAFSSNDKTISLLDLPEIINVEKFEICLSTVKSLCFFNDDLLLLVGEENGCVRGFNFFDKVQVFLLCGAKNGLVFSRVSENNQIVIVGDGQGFVRLWDRNQFKLVAIVRSFKESIDWSQKYQEFQNDFKKFYNE